MSDLPAIPRRKHLNRPLLAVTLDPEVDRIVRERAKTEGIPVSHVVEKLLRPALGMLGEMPKVLRGRRPKAANDQPEKTTRTKRAA